MIAIRFNKDQSFWSIFFTKIAIIHGPYHKDYCNHKWSSPICGLTELCPKLGNSSHAMRAMDLPGLPRTVPPPPKVPRPQKLDGNRTPFDLQMDKTAGFER